MREGPVTTLENSSILSSAIQYIKYMDNKCLCCGKPVKNKYCNTSCLNRHRNPLRKKKQTFLNITCVCENCGSEFTYITNKKETDKGFKKRFCCISCANVRHHSKETREKISKSLYGKRKNKLPKDPIRKICIGCGDEFLTSNKKKKFCNRVCGGKYLNSNNNPNYNIYLRKLRAAGIKSAKRRVLRNRNEIYFYELCKKKFKDVKHNKNIFNGWDADVIIEDIKYAILWNGKWHYEKITKNHSVEQVQNRDKIKIDEIKKAGYVPYVIKDMGSYDEKFVDEQFSIFIHTQGGPVTQGVS